MYPKFLGISITWEKQLCLELVVKFNICRESCPVGRRRTRKSLISNGKRPARSSLPARRMSHLAVLGKRMHLVPGNNKVVEDAHVDKCQRLHERARQQQVGLAGGGHAGWVVMRQHHAGRVAGQRFAHHFAGIHAGVESCAPSAK